MGSKQRASQRAPASTRTTGKRKTARASSLDLTESDIPPSLPSGTSSVQPSTGPGPVRSTNNPRPRIRSEAPVEDIAEELEEYYDIPDSSDISQDEISRSIPGADGKYNEINGDGDAEPEDDEDLIHPGNIITPSRKIQFFLLDFFL
jgi:hypothetical protein